MKRRLILILRGLLLGAILFLHNPEAGGFSQVPVGTVTVGTGNGRFSEFDQNGTLLRQLDTGTGSTSDDGCAFDSSGNFYGTNFNANNVSKFDPTGTLVGPFGSGYNASPESILFDGAGNAYVGQADGTHNILKFDSSGTPIGSFSPATEDRGTDWIDLAGDQCTMFYTSEGKSVKRFDVCANTQLPDFNLAPLPGAFAFAHKILLASQFGAGGVLVADTQQVLRLDQTGAQVQTYTVPGTSVLFALTLDPDGTSFWTADVFKGLVFKIDIQTGTVLKSWSAAGAPGFVAAAGLCVKGELNASAAPDCSGSAASSPTLWPPNHEFVSESVTGVTTPPGTGPVTIAITGIRQDEPVHETGTGSGDTCPDGTFSGATAQVRAERAGNPATSGDGRVYHIAFTATNAAGGSCKGTVPVCVPHDQGQSGTCVDEGPVFDSTGPCM